MRRSNFTTLIYLLLVFASGMVLGGFANRLYMMKTYAATAPASPPPSPKTRIQFRKEYIQEMRTRLKLTEPQVAELQQIMQTTDHRLRDMHKDIDDEHAQKVSAMLNDSQKAEYAKMREERERKRQQREQKGL
jgi:Spy/CpxP family protein refolding chaperone